MEALTAGRDEVLKRMVDGLSALLATVETIKHGEESIQRFSEFMIHVRELRSKLQSQHETVAHKELTCSVLLRMEAEVNKAREAIDVYKSKSRLLRPFIYHSVMSRLNQFFKMTAVPKVLLLSEINDALDINEILESMINGMESMNIKLQAMANAKETLSKVDMHIYRNSRNQHHTGPSSLPIWGLKGAGSSSVCPYPIHFKDKLVGVPEEESEGVGSDNDSHDSQWSDNMKIASPLPSTSTIEITTPPSSFFLCHLTGEILEDPVSVICDHSFERTAIEDYFHAGNNLCPLCNNKLSLKGKLELISNSTLLGSILEWKKRNEQIKVDMNAKRKFIDAAAKITPNDLESTNRALEELQDLMTEMPSCISEAIGNSSKLVPKITELLKIASAKTTALFKCLFLIASFSDENKKIIGRRGVIKRILEESMRDANAVELLLELSKNHTVAGKIGETTYSITILVSLLDNPSSDVADMARRILENLSFDINSTITMAKLGYFTPFLEQFNSRETLEETRTFMAEELAQMQLTEAGARNLENQLFIGLLTEMLCDNSSSSKMASLKCIKQFIAFKVLSTCFLQNVFAIRALLYLITSKAIEIKLQQEALDIVILLIEYSQPPEYESSPGFQVLFSCDNIQDILEKIKTSAREEQLILLHLLLIMVQKSEAARECILSDHNMLTCLFSAVNVDQNSSVKFSALKLIYYITVDHPIDIPLPPSPFKESFVRSIITIVNESCMDEELAAAAGIISHLPLADKSINEMLQSPTVLKSIRGLLSRASKFNVLLENALGALLRCINQSSTEFQKQVCKSLQTDLVQILSTGSPSAKQHAALILAHLSLCTVDPSSVSSPSQSEQLTRRIANMIRPLKKGVVCPLHGSNCSLQRIVCLATERAVKPLIEMMKITESGAPEAALMALDTLFDSGCNFDVASAAIVECEGATLILDVLEMGAIPVKERALELFRKIFRHPDITEKELDRFRGLLLNLVRKDDGLKHKAEIVLKFLV